jgi:hypothetical protein
MGMTDHKTALLIDRLTKVYADGTQALDARRALSDS